VSRAVLPRAMKDGVIMLQSLVGRGDAIDGDVFKWIFPIGPTYWGQAANDIQYIKDQAKGNVKGKKVAFLYIDYPFGQEPIGVLKTIAAKEGIDLQLFPHPLPGNDQAGAWSQIRRFNPDWIIHWGFSNMHVVASREMKRNGISMDKYIAVNWLNEVDIANIGPDVAKGLKRGTNVLGGTGHPLIQQILKDLYDKGKGNGDRKLTNDVYYNTGLAMYSVAFEGARAGDQERRLAADAEKMKKGFESLRNFDANGLMAPMTVTAKDHGGGGKTRIEMWDGAKWVPQTDWMPLRKARRLACTMRSPLGSNSACSCASMASAGKGNSGAAAPSTTVFCAFTVPAAWASRVASTATRWGAENSTSMSAA
jgi:branched-chain amino acid transport system substrate-binding protein